MFDEWISSSVVRQLEADEVQIWRLTVANAQGVLEECRQILSSDERDRADRRLPGRIRDEFIYGRACLRLLLSKNLGVSAPSVLIEENQYGKPYLPDEPVLEFNVSHSHGIALIALSRKGSVGIDIEYMSAFKDVMKLEPMVFSSAAMDRLRALNTEAERRYLFYQAWTRKEAIVKADGRGLSFPLANLDIADEPALNMPVWVENKLYYLNDVAAGEGYLSAIAVESHNCRVCLHDFPLPFVEP